MKILHIVKKPLTENTKKIIDIQKAGNDLKVVEIYKGGVAYDKLVADIFGSDKVFCW